MTFMGLNFRATIRPYGPAAAIFLEADQVTELGGGLTAPVKVTIDGHTERLRVASMSDGPVIGLRREVREAWGIEAGQEVDVTIELDSEPRVVDVPEDLATLLEENPEACQKYESLSYSKQKELVRRITDARKPETRQRRLNETIDQLREHPEAGEPGH